MVQENIDISSEVSFIWDSADVILRDVYKQYEYQDIILPFVVLRRIECVLLEKRVETEAKYESSLAKLSEKERLAVLSEKVKSAIDFDNSSKFTLKVLASEKETSIKDNFRAYLNGYTENIQEIMRNFKIIDRLKDLDKHKVLGPLVKQYCEIDLSPKVVSNLKMGYIFEELIRKFSEARNEEAGQHFTPREIIRLMAEILIDNEKIEAGEMKRVYDPACGTGGMLTVSKDYIMHRHPKANVVLYGQEVNPETYAVCASDMLLKGENPFNIKREDTLANDQLPGEKFDYLLSNPPFGKDWKKVQTVVKKDKRFNKDMLPRVSDGSTLFLMNMLSKMKTPQEGKSSIAIIFNGAPLFTGDADSGESNFRKYLLENDLLEAIIALPTELFYNTGIPIYIWIIRNKKEPRRKGKVQLINAVDFYEKMKKSLGNKRNLITDQHILRISEIYQSFKESEHSKIFDNSDFGYTRVSLELSELDENGKPKMETVMKTVKGKEVEVTRPMKTKDYEYVPLKQSIETYLKKEVEKPYKILKQDIGYEINVTQYFYKYKPLRPTEQIAKELSELEKQNHELMKELGLMK